MDVVFPLDVRHSLGDLETKQGFPLDVLLRPRQENQKASEFLYDILKVQVFQTEGKLQSPP